MTEEEVAGKWCPYTGSHEGAFDPKHQTCIGSRCMAWRWLPLMADEAFKAAVSKAKDDIGDKTPAGVKASQHVIANRAAYGLPDKPFDGYCGLAGKPS